MKNILYSFLIISFGCLQLNSQVVIKHGPHINGALGNPHGTKMKPHPHNRNGNHNMPSSGIVIKPSVRPRPSHGSNSGNHWMPGHWYINQQTHKRIWVEGYGMIVMEGGIYVQGHWIQSAHGLKWVPAHWINNGLPIYKGKK